MNLIQRIIQVSNLCPDAIAVVDKRKNHTYREIDEYSNAIAHHLVFHLHGGSFRCVAILLPRSVEVIEAYLGIIKADACVLCINDRSISIRELDIIKECAPDTIITVREELIRYPEIAALSCKKLVLDEQSWSKDDYLPINFSEDSHPAHVVFTSGTTGRPKGVVYSLRNRTYFVHPKISEGLPLEQSMRQVCVMDLDDTLGTATILRPMVTGGTAYIAPPQLRNDMQALASFARRHNINRVFLPNSVVPLLLREPNHGITHILSSCERLERVTPEMLQGILLENLYGSTETGEITRYRVTGNEAIMPIGRADDFVSVFLLDDKGAPVAKGLIGEVYVSSPGVAMGYLNDDVLTKERFLPCPFLPGERMFRTGDYAYYNADGQLIYCGRQDGRVKIRGYRVYLGEIENTVLLLNTVRQAVVKLFDEKLVCLYYSGQEEPGTIKEHLRNILPSYMLPHQIIPMESFPLQANGKIARNCLEKPLMSASKPEPYSSETERMLCQTMGEVLGIDPKLITPNDDFFDLGGDSLSDMQWVTRIHRDNFSFANLYIHRTPREIARHLDHHGDPNVISVSSDESARKNWQPFSIIMREMLDCQQVYPDASMWNVAQLYRLADKVNLTKLKTVLKKVCRHHPALNSIVERHGEIYGLHYLNDLQSVIEELSVDESAADYIAKQHYSFVIEDAKPLYQVSLLNATDGRFLFIVAHHLIIDGFSLNILHNEIEQVYRGKELPRDNFFSYLQQQSDSRSLAEYSAVCQSMQESLSSDGFQNIIPPVCDCNENHLAMYHYPLSIHHAPGNIELMAASMRAVGEMCESHKIRLNWTFHNRQLAAYDHSVGAFLKTYTVAADIALPQTKWQDLIQSQMNQQIAASQYDYIFCAQEEAFVSDSIEINNMLPLMAQQNPVGRLLIPVATPQTNLASSTRLEVDIIATAGKYELSVQYMTPLYDEASIRQLCKWIDHFLIS